MHGRRNCWCRLVAGRAWALDLGALDLEGLSRGEGGGGNGGFVLGGYLGLYSIFRTRMGTTATLPRQSPQGNMGLKILVLSGLW